MSPEMGVYTLERDIARMATHVADLDAHTRNIQELLRVGEYYTSWARDGGESNIVLTQDRLYATPFHIARDITVDRIAVRCQTLEAGKSARLGIYNNGTNLYPGTLLLDAGVVSLAAVAVVAATIDQALTKGLYWIALISNATGTAKITFQDAQPLFLGVSSVNLYEINGHWYKADTYGALPDPFPAGGSIAVDTHPIISLRIKSLD